MPPRPVALLLAVLAALPGPAVAAEGLPLTVLTERTGPAAAAGTPLANGLADYLTMLGRRDGGVGGVPLAVEECETGGEPARALACYEAATGAGQHRPGARQRRRGPGAAAAPRRGPDAPRRRRYGPAAMARGDVFPLGLRAARHGLGRPRRRAGPPLPGRQRGSPQGRSLAYLHRDSPAGREPVP